MSVDILKYAKIKQLECDVLELPFIVNFEVLPFSIQNC